jgi:gliding motility-associated-like protein
VVCSPPSAPVAIHNSGCSGTSILLGASGGSPGLYLWYPVSTGGSALPGEVNDSFTTPTLTINTSYWVTITDGPCESPRTEVIATVIPLPTAPSSPVNGSLCGAGAVSVSVSGGTNGQYRWYTASTGGTAIAGEVNSSYTTPSLSTTANYYAAINDGTCESARALVTATINPTPSAPTSPIGASLCGAGSVTVSVSGGTNGQYRWYTTSTGGTALVGEVNSTYTAPAISATTNYFATLNVNGCESPTRTMVTAVIKPIPPPPAAPAVSRCGSGTVTLTASGASGTQEYRWYDVATGGTSQSSSANFTTTPLVGPGTTFYVSVFDVATTCESGRTAVDALVNTPPAPPTTISNSGCSGTSISLSATGGSAGQFRWYNVATGGTAIAGFVNGTFATPTLTATTSFFAAINDGTCESTRSQAVATVNPLPAAPVANVPAPVCPGSQVNVIASGGTNGQYRWYDGAAPIPNETDGSYSISNLALNKTLQVSIVDAITGCESTKTSVLVAVKNCTPPAISTTTSSAFLEGIVTIDLLPLISDAENDFDVSSITILSLSSQAPFNLNGVLLNINYAGRPFAGTDIVTLRACDLTALCTQQQLTINLDDDITVFNAVSPNGDGKNDFLYIRYIDILPNTKDNIVSIFNRWGDVVFETEDYDNVKNVFTGLSNSGDAIPTGTYFYRIRFLSGSAPKSGFIALRK